MKMIFDKVQVALRKCKTNGLVLNSGICKDKDNMQNFIHQDIAYKFLNTVRGSPPHFQQVSKELFSMIRHLGPATIFCSFSAAGTHWLHLLKTLDQLVDNKVYSDEELEQMSWLYKSHLIQSDPVTCARKFDFQVQCLLKLLQHPLKPLGEIADFFYRVEFQHRGSPHIHCLLWVANSPNIDTDTKESVEEFIDQYITCHRPADGSDDEIAEYVNYQQHRHSYTCRKAKNKICRFSYPQPPMLRTQILEPLLPTDEDYNLYRNHWQKIYKYLNDMKLGQDLSFSDLLMQLDVSEETYIKAVRSSINTPTVFLKRTPFEIRVNPYNRNILLAWRANMDVQFVTDIYACATYVTLYVTKSQRGINELLRKTDDEARKRNQSLRQQFRTVGNKFLNATEISAQEAAYLLIQLPRKKASRQVIFINTNLPEDRVFLPKPQQILETMKDEQEDIEASSVIDKYQNRPPSLEHLSLAEFASSYNFTNQSPQERRVHRQKTDDGLLPEKNINESSENFIHENDDNDHDDHHHTARPEDNDHNASRDMKYKKRKVSRILRTCHFDMETQPEKHFHELLLLYASWRDKDALKVGCETYRQRYQQQVKHTLQEERQKLG